MLTQCPSCHTSFQITGSILRAAHGQVRCGHCNTQFDAIEHLIDSDLPDDTGAASAALEESSEPSEKEIIVEEPFVDEEITLEGSRIEISGTYRTVAGDEHPHTQTIVQEFTASDDFEQPPTALTVDDREEIVADDLTDEFAAVRTRLPYGFDTPAVVPSPDRRPPDSAAREPIFTEPPRRSPTIGIDEFDGAYGQIRSGWWVAISTVMLLALIAQVVNHYRQDLARRADLGPYLTQLYATLGLPLEPRWDLSAYAVQQWGVISDPSTGGTLRVRASIANNAAFAQPYPLLKLTLEDRFGAQVGTREFKPEEYLDSATRAKRLLDPGQSVNADIAIVDPGEEAVGFHVNVCVLRAAGSQCSG